MFLDVLRAVHEFFRLSAGVNLRVFEYMVNSRLRQSLSDSVIFLLYL